MEETRRNETGMLFVFCQILPTVRPQVPNGPETRRQEAEVRSQKAEIKNQESGTAEGRKRLTNEAGMSFTINRYRSRFMPQVPNVAQPRLAVRV